MTQTNVMFNPHTSPYNSLWKHSIEMASPSFGVSASEMVVQSKDDIKSGIELLTTKAGDSLVVPSNHSHFGIRLSSRNLPATIELQLCTRIPGSPTKVD